MSTDLQNEDRKLSELLCHGGVILRLAENRSLIVAVDHLNHHQRLVLPLPIRGNQPELVALHHLVVEGLRHEDGADLWLHVKGAHCVSRGDLVPQLGIGAWVEVKGLVSFCCLLS